MLTLTPEEVEQLRTVFTELDRLFETDVAILEGALLKLRRMIQENHGIEFEVHRGCHD